MPIHLFAMLFTIYSYSPRIMPPPPLVTPRSISNLTYYFFHILQILLPYKHRRNTVAKEVHQHKIILYPKSTNVSSKRIYLTWSPRYQVFFLPTNSLKAVNGITLNVLTTYALNEFLKSGSNVMFCTYNFCIISHSAYFIPFR